MKSELDEYIKNNRREFSNAPLGIDNLATTPGGQFELWFDQALKSSIVDPYAFTLATANDRGEPSARVVYMREFNDERLTFFTNYGSRKGAELIENPRFCANFYWEELSRQVRFYGEAKILSPDESDDYFASRPRESQIGAWASRQSEELESRRTLQERMDELTAEFADRPVPRPEFWGGFALVYDRVEFWQGRAARLHDRFEYTKRDHAWHKVRLSP